MIARRWLGALALALLAGPAAGQSAARQRQLPLPLPPPEPPPLPSASEPAPVPNNDLEDPGRRAQAPRPQFNPALIDPADPQAATTNDSNGLRAREERLLRNPAPGARLRVPFSY